MSAGAVSLSYRIRLAFGIQECGKIAPIARALTFLRVCFLHSWGDVTGTCA